MISNHINHSLTVTKYGVGLTLDLSNTVFPFFQDNLKSNQSSIPSYSGELIAVFSVYALIYMGLKRYKKEIENDF